MLFTKDIFTESTNVLRCGRRPCLVRHVARVHQGIEALTVEASKFKSEGKIQS